MKKFFLTVMLVAMMLVLTACGSKNDYLGLWKYKISSTDYTVELLKDGTWKMQQGEATREGTYTVKEENGYTLITLDYKGSYGYMKWEDGKMCAWESEKCSFEFERASTSTGGLINN